MYALVIDVLRADARVWYIDMRLDAFVDKFHPALLRAVGNNDQDPRYAVLMQARVNFEETPSRAYSFTFPPVATALVVCLGAIPSPTPT